MMDYITLFLLTAFIAYYFWEKRNKDNKVIDIKKIFEDSFKPIETEVATTVAIVENNLKNFKKESIEEIKVIAASALEVETKLSNPLSAGQFGNWQLQLFLEKSTLSSDHYRLEKGHDDGRPDAEIDLPGNGKIFIDAKAILQSWLEKFDNVDEDEKQRLLKENANNIISTAKELSLRGYQNIDVPQTGMIVMFIPLDSILIDFMDRVDKDTLFEASKGYRKTTGQRGAPIVFASPATLGGFLGMVGLLWRERNIFDDQTALLSKIKTFSLTLQTTARHMIEGSRHHVKAGDSFRKGYDNLSKTSTVIEDLSRLTDTEDLNELIDNDSYGQVNRARDLTKEKVEAWVSQNPELAKEIYEEQE